LSEIYLKIFSKEAQADKINKALKETNIYGRFQVIKRNPLFIIDASHNPEGVKNFVKNIKSLFPEKKKIIIFSVLKDKNHKKMLSDIMQIANILVISSSLNKRSLSMSDIKKNATYIIDDLKKHSKKYPESIISVDNIENAVKLALNLAKNNDIIALTGSITNLEFVKIW